MKCRDCENLGWSYDEGERIYWCYVKRVYCPDLDIERSCSYFSLKKLDIFTTLSTLQAENAQLRAELEYEREHANAYYEECGQWEAENEKLRDELEQVKHALAMMWFAYVNSDKETPHSYETEAIEEAERLLGPWEECMPKYLRRGQKEN